MIKKTFLLSVTLLLAVVLTSFAPVSLHETAAKPALRTIVIDPGHGFPDGGAEGQFSNESSVALIIALKLGKLLEEELPDCKIVYTRTGENLPGGLKDKNEANRLRARMANEAHGDLFISIHLNEGGARYRSKVTGYRTETYYSKKSKKKKTRRVPIVKRYRLPGVVSGTETYVWSVDKNDQKKQFVGSAEEEEHESEKGDSDYHYFDSPEAKIMASLRTRKYFDNSCLIASYVEEEFVKSGRSSRGVKQRDWEGIWVLQATAMPSILVETGFINTPADEAYLNSEKGQNEVSNCIKKAVLRYKAHLENQGK
ncbi:N-acetylmuramoyl-L-alanine amidase family protein [Deminuibacter soli]|uniref:N-acetylmuramoyl-L-alanine amidase n=1 Tax=Deminuibacter soli TaxID=2291815 RepID=A0A3E1NH24_9BACT|nr:N-acetylmuramoyl-L-alanine amidase [Deminuibacter soli]RFM27098.1 N-acetylmuramoyl-L-alanine amidase [Deminuibacter soli]